MPTRSNARRSTQPDRRALDASHSVFGGYCLGSHVERARAAHDRGSRVLLRRSGTPQERAQHDDDERGRARRDRRAVDVGRIFNRIRPRQLVVRGSVVARPESRGAHSSRRRPPRPSRPDDAGSRETEDDEQGVLSVFFIPMTTSLPSQFKVGLVQMSMSDDTESNLGKAVARIRDAAQQGATLVCLPELFRTQYIGQREDHALFDLAEAVPGPTTETLGKIAKENGVVVIASLFERRAAGLYHNTAAVIDADGKVKGIYRKMHIPDDPAYYEKFYFTPGDLGFRAFDTKVGPIGALVCWDQWYPEGARITALQGANILLYPTAIGWHPSEKEKYGEQQLDAWKTIQRSHAIANGCWVAAVNRVGAERLGGEGGGGGGGGGAGIEFWGHSFVCDPFGVVIAEAAEDEALLLAQVDLARIEEVRRNWPFLRDRRIDAYSDIQHRFLTD